MAKKCSSGSERDFRQPLGDSNRGTPIARKIAAIIRLLFETRLFAAMSVKRTDLRVERVLLSATGEVKQQIERLLNDARLNCRVCENCGQFCDEILNGGAVGIIQMELLTPQVMNHLVDTIARQETWSDFPLIVLCRASGRSALTGCITHLLESLGNFTILHEPVSALLSAMLWKPPYALGKPSVRSEKESNSGIACCKIANIS